MKKFVLIMQVVYHFKHLLNYMSIEIGIKHHITHIQTKLKWFSRITFQTTLIHCLITASKNITTSLYFGHVILHAKTSIFLQSLVTTFTICTWSTTKSFSLKSFWLWYPCPYCSSSRTKMGPQRHLGITLVLILCLSFNTWKPK